MLDLLKTYPVIVTQTLAWGEMDAFAHINNVVYFRYFENARLEYFRQLGWPCETIPTGVGPILGSTQARFRLPLTYPDTIAIGGRIVDIQADRVIMRHAIASEKLNKIATEGESVIVTYDYGRKEKAVVPAELLRKILELEARVGNAPTRGGA